MAAARAQAGAGAQQQPQPQHPAVFTHATFDYRNIECTGVSVDVHERVFIALKGKGVAVKAPGATKVCWLPLPAPLKDDLTDLVSGTASPEGTVYARTESNGIWRFHSPISSTDGGMFCVLCGVCAEHCVYGCLPVHASVCV